MSRTVDRHVSVTFGRTGEAGGLVGNGYCVRRVRHGGGRQSYWIFSADGEVHRYALGLLTRYGPATQQTYAYCLVDHLEWLDVQGKEPTDINLDDLCRYMNEITGAPGVYLTSQHFGVDPKWGYGKVHVTEENRAEIQRLLSEQGRDDIGVDDVVRDATAQYQYRRDIDYKVRDGFVYLIDRINGEVRTDFETGNDVRITNDIHKALEAKENLVEKAAGRAAGVPIRNDAESSTEITSQQYYNEVRREDPIALISGTATESSEVVAENYDRMGPVVRVEKFNPSQVIDHDDMMFDNQHAKLAWIAEKIQSLHETGQPVLYGADRDDKPGALARLLTEMNIPHDVIGDAAYQLDHGATWREDMEADIKEKSGKLGAVTLVSAAGARGTDYRVTADAKPLGGIFLIIDGRSGITDVVDTQFKNRVGRAGDRCRRAHPHGRNW